MRKIILIGCLFQFVVLSNACTDRSVPDNVEGAIVLKRICFAEEEFKIVHGRYGSLEELCNDKRIKDGRNGEKILGKEYRGYFIKVNLKSDGYYATAIPVTHQDKQAPYYTFYVDEKHFVKVNYKGEEPGQTDANFCRSDDREVTKCGICGQLSNDEIETLKKEQHLDNK